MELYSIETENKITLDLESSGGSMWTQFSKKYKFKQNNKNKAKATNKKLTFSWSEAAP